MKKLLASLLLVCIFFAATAQKPPIKFGDISMDEMTMTSYAKDTSAVAVILADYGEARISPFQEKLIYERHRRIKILKQEGLSWADVVQPLFRIGSARESLGSLKAVTYNLENGKIVETKMSSSADFDEKFNKNIDNKKFTLPNVKVGSVIEYSYKITSDFMANYPSWAFQHDIPVIYSEFRAYIPNFFMYERYMKGYLSVEYEVKDLNQAGYTDKIHRWILKDGPAFKPEPYMTGEEDYRSKINFALSHYNFPGQPIKEVMGSWEKLVGTWMGYESFGKTITGNNFLKKRNEEILGGETDPEKKVKMIYDWVKSNIEWNGTTDAFADNVKDILETKTGTSGDINLTLASMLEKAGFDVEPIMLSTRDHGFIRRNIPVEAMLNYVICSVVIGDKQILLDATEKYLPMGVIPERCYNGEAIKVSISKKTFLWINMTPSTKSKTVVNADLTLDESGTLKGHVKETRTGYYALSHRKKFNEKGSEEDYIKAISNEHNWSIESTDLTGIDDLDASTEEQHEITIDDQATMAGDLIYVNPLFGYSIDENPFKSEKRIYPVDFGSPWERVLISKITIPDGYEVDEVPESKATLLPGNAGRFIYNVAVTGNVISITSNFTINKALFGQQEYPYLREFYNLAVSKQTAQIVLKKK